MKTALIILLLFLTVSAQASSNLESFYQDQWCKEHKGQAEAVLPDRTRCDCLTETHAIEFDFGKKWAEAIGQSLYYSLQTGKKAGIVLILEDESDYKFWIRLNTTITHFKLPIDTWMIKPDSLQPKQLPQPGN
jgi:hypothetical protein